jgi:steroid 5-alpha reductase family enzyme
MKATTLELLQALAATLAALIVGWAGSQHGYTTAGMPLMLVCVLIAFLVQWLVFIHAWSKRTERYFDLTGSITYLCLLAVALALGNSDPRSLLIALLVAIWAFRLGSFLFRRVTQSGHDRRFNQIKHSFTTFFMTWTLQGLWVSLTVACALAAMTALEPVPLGPFAIVGAMLWLFGFGVEVVADRQKSAFRALAENQDRFISTGLWAWSRHPNYFGEIVLWLGIALIALPVLSGWQHLTLISPLFVYLLLTRISGVRMLERRADRVWGEDVDYQNYRARTPELMLRPPG